MSLVFLTCLPETPSSAAWLSPGEKTWLAQRLTSDVSAGEHPASHGLRNVLTNPMVILMGLVNLLWLGTGYAFTLSAPGLLDGATHLGATRVGYLVAAGGLLGALAMMGVAWSSDRTGERHFHLAVPLVLGATGFAIMSLWHAPIVTIGAYLLTQTAQAGAAAVFWLIPSDSLRDRSAAVGIAVINGIGMIGSFSAPFVWGVLKDRTGDFEVGLRSLPILLLLATGIVMALRFGGRRTA